MFGANWVHPTAEKRDGLTGIAAQRRECPAAAGRKVRDSGARRLTLNRQWPVSNQHQQQLQMGRDRARGQYCGLGCPG